MKIYNLICLIFKLCYTFLHRSGASYRKRLGRWSARRHCRSRRHRSLEYRQLCHGRMQTYLRWSKYARIQESRRRNWTTVCLIFRFSFKQTSFERLSRVHAKPPRAQTRCGSNQYRRPSNQSSDELTRQGCQISGIRGCSRPS